jgi:hypothetical protein
MGLGQLRGPSWLTGTPLHCPQLVAIIAQGGLEVCDAAHRWFVMKKGQVSGCKNGNATSRSLGEAGELELPLVFSHQVFEDQEAQLIA